MTQKNHSHPKHMTRRSRLSALKTSEVGSLNGSRFRVLSLTVYRVYLEPLFFFANASCRRADIGIAFLRLVPRPPAVAASVLRPFLHEAPAVLITRTRSRLI